MMTACDPMEDINKELEEMPNYYIGKETLTLSSADYDQIAALAVKGGVSKLTPQKQPLLLPTNTSTIPSQQPLIFPAFWPRNTPDSIILQVHWLPTITMVRCLKNLRNTLRP